MEEKKNLLVKSFNELIAKAFEQFPSLETIIRPFGRYALHVLVELVHAILVGRILSDKWTHVVLFLENGKEEILERMLLILSKHLKGGQAIPSEIGFITWPDTGGDMVDRIERTNEDVGEYFDFDAVRG